MPYVKVINKDDDDDDDDGNNNNNNNDNNNNKTTENSHIGRCTHTAESANVEIQWSQRRN
jgi:hypothetical protein